MKSKAQQAADRVEQVIQQEIKKGGFRGRINAFCASCIYDPYSKGTWLEQVANCTSNGTKNSTLCPLYEVRPTPRKRGEGK